LKKEKKANLVDELKSLLGRANCLLVSDYRGLTVEKITVLRKRCRASGASIRVIKNTLAKKAIPGTPFAAAEGFFQGPTAVTISSGDPVGIIKALTTFSKENEQFKIKGGIMDGGKFSSEELFRIATLPSREVLLGRLVGSINSPLARMVGTLSNPLRGLVGVLNAIGKAKEAH